MYILNSINKQKLIITAMSAGALCITFFFFGPMLVFLRNLQSLWFSLGTAAATAAVCAIIVFLPLTAILYFLPDKCNRVFVAVIIGIASGLFLQGLFLQIDYGALDGREVNWSDYTLYAIFNTLVWLVCISAPVFFIVLKPMPTEKIIKTASAFIFIVQAVFLIFTFFTTPKQSTKPMQTIKDLFTLSSSKNVVVFIVDQLDSAYMNEVLEIYPEVTELLTDFTYYRNTLGMFPTTKGAIPFFYTGVPFTNNETFDEYMEKNFDSSPLFNTLLEYDYTIGLYANWHLASDSLIGKATNVIAPEYRIVSYPTLFSYLYQLTAIRYAPHILKQFVWMYTGDFSDFSEMEAEYPIYPIDDVRFMRQLQDERIFLTDTGNAFRFYHLRGSHGPFTYDETATPIKQGETGSAVSQTRGTFHIIREYMDQLIDLGIYDDTMIVITADHGNFDMRQSISLMVKNRNERKEFSISNAPVSFADIMPTILNVITGSKDHSPDIRDLNENTVRSRIYMDYSWDGDWWSPFLPDIFMYVWKDEAYDPKVGIWAGQIFSSNEINTEKVNSYELGSLVSLTPWNENGLQYFPDGAFNNNESVFGVSGELVLSLEEVPADDLLMSLTFKAFTGNKDHQTIAVYVNDRLVSENRYTSADEYDSYLIPGDIIDSKVLNFRFEIIDADPLARLSLNSLNDNFVSFVIKTFIIDHARNVTVTVNDPVLTIDFSINGNSESFIAGKWYDKEETGRWTRETNDIIFHADGTHDLEMYIYGRSLDNEITTDLMVNGHYLTRIEFMDDDVAKINIPFEFLVPGGAQLLQFVTENAATPDELWYTGDSRRLGIFIESIIINLQ